MPADEFTIRVLADRGVETRDNVQSRETESHVRRRAPRVPADRGVPDNLVDESFADDERSWAHDPTRSRSAGAASLP